MKELEDYRCVIDPYNNDYGARGLFEIWESRLNTENLPSFWMWLEQFKRTDQPSDNKTPILANFLYGRVFIDGKEINSGLYNYAISSQKNVYLSASRKHTSLSEGLPVLGAGKVYIKDGVITEINTLKGVSPLAITSFGNDSYSIIPLSVWVSHFPR